MNLSRAAAFAFALILASAAFAAEALTGFSHDNKGEMFGYYSPKSEVRLGKFRLERLSIGTLDELRDYEKGKDRMPTYAPVMFTFEDLTSKKLKDENGDTYYANEPRVLPSAYRIKGNTIAFTGTDKQVGAVSFTGTFDMAPVKAAQAQDITFTDKAVVTGDLTVAGKVFKGVSFSWFGGD